MVDDGSTDNSGLICDEYSVIDERCIVVHQKNGGQSSARNKGLFLMNSEFVTFVDSDDYISGNYLCTLLSAFSDPEVAISVCEMICGSQDKYEFDNSNRLNRIIITGLTWCIIHYLRGPFKAFPWGKMYRTELIADKKFPEGIVYEDEAIIPIIMYEAKKVSYNKTPEYYYYQRGDSTIGSGVNNYKYNCLLTAHNISISYFKEHSCCILEEYANIHKDYYGIIFAVSGTNNNILEIMSKEKIEKKLIDLYPSSKFVSEIDENLVSEINNIFDSNYYSKYYLSVLLSVYQFFGRKKGIARSLLKNLLKEKKHDSRWTIKTLTSAYAIVYPCRTWAYRKIRNVKELIGETSKKFK